MKKIYTNILIITLLVLSAGLLSAQNLPLMPSDPAVSSGTLPNGMSYYIVENPTSKGLADFALVQRTGSETVPDGQSADVFMAAKDALAFLPRVKGGSTQAFLARNGITPEKDGFVKVSESATVFHFDNIVVSAGNEVVDSTLLVLLDIADRSAGISEGSLGRWYTPADQAVVVSGDVKPGEIISKLRLMSLMTPAGESHPRKAYVWQDSEEPVFESSSTSRNLASVSATWASPRTPVEYMNTVQPAIYAAFVSELGILAKERLKQRFRNEGVPVADISYSHLNSIRSLGDESFTVSVAVAPEYVDRAVKALAEVMSALDEGKVTAYELDMAKSRYMAMVTERSDELMKSNSDYVERCASAFLYNAPLSSDKEVLAFLKSRDLSQETELRLFNNVVSALLDGRRNLTVECRTGGGFEMDSALLKDVFTSAWERGTDDACQPPRDSLPLPAAGEKIKVRSSRSEYMTGGVMWTFDNGFRVIYTRKDTGRRLHYSLALNGGYGNIADLSKGEGAYMSDFLGLCRVSGMSGDEFRLALEREGMSMKSEVNLSNMIISGSLPEDKAEFLMQVLLAVANEHEPDMDAYDYYRNNIDCVHEFSRGEFKDRTAAVDSLMCPDYIYSPMKTPGRLTEEFPQKASAFLAAQMQKMNDGLLVLIGNIEETRMRKLLQLYVGGFSTTLRSHPRTVVNYQPVSGASSCTVRGRRNSADVAISLRQTLTAENYAASALAAEVLKRKISESLSGTGSYIRMSSNFRIYPNERFNVMITMEEASPDGFATGVELTGFDEALARLRATLEDLSSIEVSDETIAGYKEVLKGHIAINMGDPAYLMRAVTMRYLDSKDLLTGVMAKIDAVSAQKVKAVLASLAGTSKVEYITRR